MAWTTPILWVVGQLVTASDMNEQVSDNFTHLGGMTASGTALSALSPGSELVNVGKSTQLSKSLTQAMSAPQKATFDGTTRDDLGLFNDGLDRIVVDRNGQWQLYAYGTDTGSGPSWRIRVNNVIAIPQIRASAGTFIEIEVPTYLNSTDYAELWLESGGGSPTLQTDAFLAAVFMGD